MVEITVVLGILLIIAILIIGQQEAELKAIKMRVWLMDIGNNMPKYENPPPMPLKKMYKGVMYFDEIPIGYKEVEHGVFKNKIGLERFPEKIRLKDHISYIIENEYQKA